MPEPVLKQQMTMHMNGGSNFSELHYAVTADDKPTGITRHVRTNGSPKYLKTIDALRCGDDEFDVLATKGVGMKDWLLDHVIKLAGEESPAPDQ